MCCVNFFGMQDHLRLFGNSTVDLEMLGKQACQLFMKENISLSDAVVKIATEQGNITTEQVRRIVESANRNTFLEGFQKEAKKTIEFDIADSDEVLRRLNTPNACIKLADYAYYRELPDFEGEEADQKLTELFLSGIEKQATEDDFDQTNFVRLQESLKSAFETLSDSVVSNSYLVKEAEDNFCLEVKRHVEDDNSISDVVCLVENLTPKYASAILTDLENRLELKIENGSYQEKLANFDNPLVKALSIYVNCIEKQAELSFAKLASEKKLNEMNQVFDALRSGLYSQHKEAMLGAKTKNIAKGVLGATAIGSFGASGAVTGLKAGDPKAKNPMRRG